MVLKYRSKLKKVEVGFENCDEVFIVCNCMFSLATTGSKMLDEIKVEKSNKQKLKIRTHEDKNKETFT